MLAIIISYWNKKCGIMSSGVPFIFWFLLSLLAIVQFRSEIKQYEAPDDDKISENFILGNIFFIF